MDDRDQTQEPKRERLLAGAGVYKMLRTSRRGRQHLAARYVRLAAIAALVFYALLTPGFDTWLSLNALINAVAFIGCVAVGMTFITVTGNIMSLCLGVTLSVSALVFLSTLSIGAMAAFVVTVLFGILITALQGFLVGYFKANPILVSIAALALLIGAAAILTGGQRVYPSGGGLQMFTGRLFGIPVNALFFFATALICQLVLSLTRIGQMMLMVGSNARAATAAGVSTTSAITAAYAVAGACTAVSGVLLAGRYGSGDMELGAGYDYTAIAAVLVGGTAIRGGSGSVGRTIVGVMIIAIIEVVLLLRGYDEQFQYFISGLVVLGVITLHTIGERH
jgi:ribose/xylose/arabinose/galactoside ABC-type transport system permease subunit